jgi:ubiquitin
MSINPMHKAHAALRCRARSKRTGKQCRAPAVRGFRVCRMHGARGGAPSGKHNGNYKHGDRTKEAIASVRETNELIRRIRKRWSD